MPAFESITQLIDRQPEHRIALETQTLRWTYGELKRETDRLASWLVERFPAESRVAVSLDRSPQLMVTVLGILKAGLAFVPIDPDYPRGRIRFMLEDIQPELFIARAGTEVDSAYRRASWRQVGSRQSIREDEDVPVATSHQDTCVAEQISRLPRPGPKHLAYAIYTSGSTGRPKAALVEHGGLANLALRQREVFQIDSDSRVLQFSSISFDASISEIFVTLAAGATLCLADPTDLVPGPRLAATLHDRKISLVTLPPSILSRIDQARLPQLTTLVVAGEACPAELVAQWSLGRTLINAYGPTEATVCASTYRCASGVSQSPPIGKPLPGVELYVLDESQREVGAGEQGELCIGGRGVARGYWNRPDMTRERFISFRGRDGALVRLYRTGDRVCQRRDGEFEFLGRLDDEVKINGIRISPQEVNFVIERQQEVERSHVCCVPGPSGPRLVAVVQWKADGKPESDAFWSALREELPIAFCPRRIVSVQEMPVSSNGKLDRGRLTQIARDSYVSPPAPARLALAKASSDARATVLSFWSDALRVPVVDEQADFFQQGGDSLAATELLIRFNQYAGTSVRMADFVQRPTPAALLEQLSVTQPKQSSNLVPLRVNQDGPVVVCLHPGGGHVLCYRSLIRHLPQDWSIYGIQATGIDGRQPAERSMQGMADSYAEQIEALGVSSVNLLGWSFGGLVAFEVAHRMAARQVRVANLWLLDAAPVYSFVVLRNLFPDPNVTLRQILKAGRGHLQAAFENLARSARLAPPNAPVDELRGAFEVFVANVHATSHYKMPIYAGEMDLLLPAERGQGMSHDVAGEWRGKVPLLREHRVGGTHLTMLKEPYVMDLASYLLRLYDGSVAVQTRRAA